MRRDLAQPLNPDVEVSRAELDALEGKKTTAEAEFLGVADTKKQLESEYESRKRDIADELAVARREADIEKQRLLAENATLKKDNAAIEQKNQSLRADTASLGEALGTLQTDTERAKAKLGTLQAEVTKLTVEKNELQSSVDRLTPEVQALGKRVDTLKQEIVELQSSKAGLTKVLETLTKDHKEKSESHASFLDTNAADKKAAEESLAKTNEDIDAKNKELTAVTAKVAELEATIAAYRDEFTKKDAEITLRMGNATRLETHVDAKLQSLKALETQFTTEHLARFGYKKTE